MKNDESEVPVTNRINIFSYMVGNFSFAFFMYILLVIVLFVFDFKGTNRNDVFEHNFRAIISITLFSLFLPFFISQPFLTFSKSKLKNSGSIFRLLKSKKHYTIGYLSLYGSSFIINLIFICYYFSKTGYYTDSFALLFIILLSFVLQIFPILSGIVSIEILSQGDMKLENFKLNKKIPYPVLFLVSSIIFAISLINFYTGDILADLILLLVNIMAFNGILYVIVIVISIITWKGIVNGKKKEKQGYIQEEKTTNLKKFMQMSHFCLFFVYNFVLTLFVIGITSNHIIINFYQWFYILFLAIHLPFVFLLLLLYLIQLLRMNKKVAKT